MRSARAGDAGAYRRVLDALAPRLRSIARRGLARAGRSDAECEDIVQETLLAIHLKRGTWDDTQPLLPWVHAIAHHKLVDALRRQGFREDMPIEICDEAVMAAPGADYSAATDARKLLSRLSMHQRTIVVGIAIEGRSAQEVGQQLGMADGTVRVALHRALKTLAAIARDKSQ